MPTVDPGYGAYLQSPARYTTARVAGAAAAWGKSVADSTIMSPLANKADADAEAIYQTQFLAGPIARDRIVVSGLQRDLIGRVVTIRGDRLGYEDGADVFVVGVAESDRARTSTLTVLKRL